MDYETISKQEIDDALEMAGLPAIGIRAVTGFTSPNFTQTPNDLFDILLRDMGEAELKVVLAVVRGTFGWHRDGFTLSLAKMAEQTGLSINGVIAGAVAAEKRGLLRRLTSGLKSTGWVAIVAIAASEVSLPQPVRQSIAAGEVQLGLKKDKETKKVPAEKRGHARPEESALLSKFSELTGLPIPQPSTAREKSSAAVRWYQPIRRMIQLADGLSPGLMDEAVKAMRANGLTIAAPQSVEAVFTAKFGERHGPIIDPYARATSISR